MPKLFHLRCSPRLDSASSAAAEAFLTKFRELRPSWDIDLQDLWRETLPEFNGAALAAKYARLGGRGFNVAERDAFENSTNCQRARRRRFPSQAGIRTAAGSISPSEAIAGSAGRSCIRGAGSNGRPAYGRRAKGAVIEGGARKGR